MKDRICIDCGVTKPLDHFYKNKSGTPQLRCKQCNMAKKSRWRKVQRDALNDQPGFIPELQRFYLSPRRQHDDRT